MSLLRERPVGPHYRIYEQIEPKGPIIVNRRRRRFVFWAPRFTWVAFSNSGDWVGRGWAWTRSGAMRAGVKARGASWRAR